MTMVASSMQERGMITYRRGRVTILSRALLEKAACHCYRVCSEALGNLYATRMGIESGGGLHRRRRYTLYLYDVTRPAS